MTQSLKKPRLGPMVAKELKRRIAAGCYASRLPGEIALSRELEVSRSILREGLGILAEEGLVFRRKGLPTVVKSGPKAYPDHEIVLVEGQPETMFPLQENILVTLEKKLQRGGIAASRVTFHGALRRARGWVEKRRASFSRPVYILYGCPRELQFAFQDAGVPCLVLGSCHEGIDLPFLDVNHAAIARHAAGRLLALGHRRIGIFHPGLRRAGDLKALHAFREEILQHGAECIDLQGTVNEAPTAQRVLRALPLFSALYATSGSAGLWLHSLLANHGVSIPGECALLSRDHFPFFSLLSPPLAGYRFPREQIIRRAVVLVKRLASGQGTPGRYAELFPEFILAGSLGKFRKTPL